MTVFANTAALPAPLDRVVPVPFARTIFESLQLELVDAVVRERKLEATLRFVYAEMERDWARRAARLTKLLPELAAAASLPLPINDERAIARIIENSIKTQRNSFNPSSPFLSSLG